MDQAFARVSTLPCLRSANRSPCGAKIVPSVCLNEGFCKAESAERCVPLGCSRRICLFGQSMIRLVGIFTGTRTVNDHDAPMTEFFLMYRLCLYKRLLEEGIQFHRLVESDHTVY